MTVQSVSLLPSQRRQADCTLRASGPWWSVSNGVLVTEPVDRYHALCRSRYTILAYYSLLATHYLLLTTHYSLPTTHYLLLTWWYSCSGRSRSVGFSRISEEATGR